MTFFIYLIFFEEKSSRTRYIYSRGVNKKERKKRIMVEMNLQQQESICGGVALSTALLYLILGTALYKIYKSKKGRISIPRLLQLEWRN